MALCQGLSNQNKVVPIWLSIAPHHLYTILNENPKLQLNPPTQLDKLSTQPAWVKHFTQAGWAEIVCLVGQTDLATNLDFHSVWYRDHLVQ